MSVKSYRADDGSLKFRVDFRNADGVRKRQSFEVKRNALEFDKEMKLLKKVRLTPRAAFSSDSSSNSIGSKVRHRKSLIEAIEVYHRTISVRKETDERGYFNVLHEFLNDEVLIGEQIEFVDQVGLMHLQQLQTYLTKKKIHTSCFIAQRRLEKVRAKALMTTDKKEAQLILGNWTALRPSKACELKPNQCRGKSLTASTVNRYFNTYRDFFNQCEGWKFVGMEDNPVRLLDDLPEFNEQKKVPALETTQAIINALDKKNQREEADALFLMLQLGPRPIELKRQEWRDVDFKLGAIRFWSKKGDGSLKERWLPMTSEVREFYAQRFESARRSFAARPVDPVFKMSTGSRFDTKRFARRVAVVCDELGIRDFVPYCLRHRVVTQLRELGFDTQTAGSVAGHSNLQTTDAVYSHLQIKHLAGPLGKLSEFNQIERSLDTFGHRS